jgi:hypothetical protein
VEQVVIKIFCLDLVVSLLLGQQFKEEEKSWNR